MKYLIKIFMAIWAVPLMFACDPSGANNEENLKLIEKYTQSVENLDYETMAACLDESYVGLGPSLGDSIGKTDALINWKDNVENLYESIKYTRSRIIPVTISTGDNQGEWVSNWAELEITYKEDLGTVKVWANSIYQIKHDKIVKSYTFYNEADVLEQLGYVFVNPNDL